MRVLFVVGKFPDLTFIFRTITAVAAQGHEVIIAARSKGDWSRFQHNPPLPENIRMVYLLPDRGYRDISRLKRLVIGLPSTILRAPMANLKLWRECRRDPELSKIAWKNFIRYSPFLKLQADVIQFDFPMTEGIYPYLAKLLDAPTVVSCRGADIHTLEFKPPSERQARIESVRRATIIHCVSDEMANEVFRVTGRREGIIVNRPAVAVEPLPVNNPDHEADMPLIITTARLTWKKGLDYLLMAATTLKAAQIPFKLKIMGDGELYSQLRFSIGDLGLLGSVELLGKVPPEQVQRELQCADLFVLSSHEEGISNAVLEAMACGLPIVTTNAGGMAEVVRDGVEGFVVPVRDIPALAEHLKILLLDAELRERMGEAARARVEDAFTLKRQARVFNDIYHAAVEEHRRHDTP